MTYCSLLIKTQLLLLFLLNGSFTACLIVTVLMKRKSRMGFPAYSSPRCVAAAAAAARKHFVTINIVY